MNRPVINDSHLDLHKHSRRALNRALVETLEERRLLTSVSGYVYNDVNLNQTYDLGTDIPMVGVTLFRDDNYNGNYDVGVDPFIALTNDQGFYQFLDQPNDGTVVEPTFDYVHVFRMICPSGYRPFSATPSEADSVTPYTPDPSLIVYDPFLTEGYDPDTEEMITTGITALDYTNQNFGITNTQKFFGAVFNDANASGTWETNETGLENWVVYADSNNNGLADGNEISATTGINGNYILDGVPAGSLSIRMVPKAGYRLTSMAEPVFSNVVARPGQTDAWYVFGVTDTNSIAGQVYIDINNSETFDEGDFALAGWTVYNDANDNGIQDASETFVIADENGEYLFQDLANGVFHIRTNIPTGWSTSYPVSASWDYDPAPVAGATYGGNDFRMLTAADTVTFTGNVYNDIDGNGTQDEGDEGLAGWIVYNDANKNGKLDSGESSVVTDFSGSYELSGLAPGALNVNVVLLPSWHCSDPADGVIQSIPIAGGDVGVTDANFGVSQAHTGSISGIAFIDLDVDGVKDPTESVFPGATIVLDTSDGDEFTTVTDANGAWSFSGLGAGVYAVSLNFNALEGTYYSSTRLGCLSSPSLARDNSSVENIQFGLTTRFSVLASAVYDTNRNRRLDNSEPFLPGWKIFADLNDNNICDDGETFGITDNQGYTWLVFPTATLSADVHLYYQARTTSAAIPPAVMVSRPLLSCQAS